MRGVCVEINIGGAFLVGSFDLACASVRNGL
jgi:hypothetical protein